MFEPIVTDQRVGRTATMPGPFVVWELFFTPFFLLDYVYALYRQLSQTRL